MLVGLVAAVVLAGAGAVVWQITIPGRTCLGAIKPIVDPTCFTHRAHPLLAELLWVAAVIVGVIGAFWRDCQARSS
jgi:hypothetical protein